MVKDLLSGLWSWSHSGPLQDYPPLAGGRRGEKGTNFFQNNLKNPRHVVLRQVLLGPFANTALEVKGGMKEDGIGS